MRGTTEGLKRELKALENVARQGISSEASRKRIRDLKAELAKRDN